MRYKFFVIYIFTVFLFANAKAQECVVLMDSLKGKYEGECKKGKADGLGKAVGIDMYVGKFKAGLPDGTGKYTWRNGNWYEGDWFKGKKEGNGKMLYKLSNNDSLVNGYWKKDVYVGKYEKPYIIHYKTVHISQVSCTKQNNLLNQLDITVDSETGGSPLSISSGSQTVPKPTITDIMVTEGSYIRIKTNDSYGKKIVYTMEEVTFPFRASFTLGNDSIDIEVLESGRWVIQMRLAY